MSKFIFITSEFNVNQTINLIKYFHLINACVLTSNFDQIQVFVPNILNLDVNITLKNQHSGNLSNLLFPDKFENLTNFTFDVYFTHMTPFFYIFDEDKICLFCEFFKIVEEKLKTNFNIQELFSEESLRKYQFNAPIVAKMEMQSNTEFYLNFYDLYQLNYQFRALLLFQSEENCLFITFPSEIPIYEQILVLPLDRTIWMMLGISTGCLACVWRLFKNFGADDSCWHFIYVVYAYFLGQSLNLRM